jgi:hypothetical protein
MLVKKAKKFLLRWVADPEPHGSAFFEELAPD